MTVVPSFELTYPLLKTLLKIVLFPRWDMLVSWRVPLFPKTNMDTQNDGLEKVDSFLKTTIFSIYVSFRGCIS